MPTSQFTYYHSGQASAPQLDGQAGSLLTILNGILVTGYGAVSGAGWSKPLADSGNIGCFMNAAGGSQMTLHLDDSGGTLTGRAACASGWESLSTLASPVGTGAGQFPTPAQFNTNGYCAWNKSQTADATIRAWQAYADAYTFYFWADWYSNGLYDHYGFGDVFSVKPTTDAYRCLIFGNANNYSNAIVYNHTDVICGSRYAAYGNSDTGWNSFYMARSSGGGGGSVIINKGGDSTCSTTPSPSYLYYHSQYGALPYGPDNALYIYPLRLFEQASGQLRGRMRGLYHPLHYYTNFSDGQALTGSGDYAGKTFNVIRLGNNFGVWMVETSNTVETN